jgi:hypothetical protein
LFLLMRIALEGKIHKKRALLDAHQIDNINNVTSLVNRMIFDPALRSEIVDGLQLAGLTVN